MKNKVLGLLVVSFCLVILTAGVAGVQTTGAPPAHTGAPGEMTCAVSGCHSDHVLNEGSGSISIEVLNNRSVNDELIDLKVIVEEVNKIRYGFELVVLDEEGNGIGELVIADEERTQIMRNVAGVENREYITYNANGTLSDVEGSNEWMLQWRRPESFEGKVIFYAAGVASNNDATDDGDETYSTQLNYEVRSTGISEVEDQGKWIILNNVIRFPEIQDNVEVFDLSGRMVESHFDIDELTLNTGIYIVRVHLGEEVIRRKIFIQ